jgi:hypothetical protein
MSPYIPSRTLELNRTNVIIKELKHNVAADKAVRDRLRNSLCSSHLDFLSMSRRPSPANRRMISFRLGVDDEMPADGSDDAPTNIAILTSRWRR